MRIILKALIIIVTMIMCFEGVIVIMVCGATFVASLACGDWGTAIVSLCLMSFAWGCIDLTLREIGE